MKYQVLEIGIDFPVLSLSNSVSYYQWKVLTINLHVQANLQRKMFFGFKTVQA